MAVDAVAMQPSVGYTFSEGYLTYEIVDDSSREVCIIGSDCPEVILGTTCHKGVTYRVSSIGDYVFDSCDSLESVVIEASGSVDIGSYAFFNCGRLRSVTIAGDAIIGAGAFRDCANLDSLYIGSIGSMGKNAFTNVPGIGGKEASEIGGTAFLRSGESLVPVHEGYEGSIGEFGVRVESVNPFTLSITGCSAIGSVAIPSNVGAFVITSVDDRAFWGLDGITSISIPSTVTRIGYEAFGNCRGLATIDVEEGNPVYRSVDGVLFRGSELIQYPAGKVQGTYAVPEGTESVSLMAFYGADGILAFSTESTAFSTDGQGALLSADGKTLVAYPSGRASDSYVVPASAVSVSPRAFSGASNLKVFKAEAGGHFSVRGGVLYSLDYMRLVAYPSGMDAGTFAVPATVTEIGDYAFAGNPYLTEAKFPSSLAMIGDYAFESCAGLERLFVGVRVLDIGDQIVYGCVSLSKVDMSSVRDDARIGHNAEARIGAGLRDGESPIAGGVRSYDGEGWVDSQYMSYGGSDSVRFSAYRFYDGKTLVVYGIGDMRFARTDFSVIKDGVDRIVVSDGVTSIPDDAFGQFSVSSLLISPSVTSIHMDAFDKTANIVYAEIPYSDVDGSEANEVYINRRPRETGKVWEGTPLADSGRSGVFVRTVITGDPGLAYGYAVTGAGFYEPGSKVELGLHLYGGYYEFLGWYMDGKRVPTQMEHEALDNGSVEHRYYTLALTATDADRVIECRLSQNPIRISYSDPEGGCISIDGIADGTAGATWGFTADMDGDYVYDQSWSNETLPTAEVVMGDGDVV
jgi:hypothetical protein